MQSTCDLCEARVDPLGVCASCGHHTALTATERVEILADTFSEQDPELTGGDPLHFDGYANAVYAARYATRLDEATIWGWAEIDRSPCALVVLDFRFLGGSMGAGVGEKVARAFDAAREQRRPLVAVTASGGARMQEGMIALAQMAKTVEARRRHSKAGLAQVTLLTSPTTGGVYASFASLADAILAEPGAHIGFAGPRLAQLLTGQMPPRDTYSPETHARHGAIDGIVHRRHQPATIGRLLRLMSRTLGEVRPPELRVFTPAEVKPDAWQRLRLARDPERPKGPAVLDATLTDAVELRGDRAGSDDSAMVVRIGALRTTGLPVIAVAQDASAGHLGAGAFHKAIRAITTAARLRLPLVTIVDSPGADPGADAEAAGIASAIAHTFSAMLDCPSETLAVLTGEGGSGGAFSMMPADRVLVWANAVFSVIAPEAASEILYRSRDRSADLATSLRITAEDLVDLRLADAIVPEPAGGAQSDLQTGLAVLGAEIGRHMQVLCASKAPSRLGARRRRWRRAGAEWLREP